MFNLITGLYSYHETSIDRKEPAFNALKLIVQEKNVKILSSTDPTSVVHEIKISCNQVVKKLVMHEVCILKRHSNVWIEIGGQSQMRSHQQVH